jgi:hypothetical protein
MQARCTARKYLTRQEAAEYLRELGYPTTKGFLQKLASTGGGPTYRLFGNKALYTPGDLIDWAESRISAPQVSTSCVEVA